MSVDPTIQRIANIIESEFGENVFLGDYTQAAKDRINLLRAEEQVEVIKRYIPETLAGKKVIEVGSSYSTLLAYLKDIDAKPFGIEPSFDVVDASYDVWDNISRGENVVVGAGEYLPFKSNTFDIAFSSNVLEHVQNDDFVIKEAVRVLKPGGYLHFVFPNYGSVWDGHYATFWIPFAPYWLGRLSMQLRGRSPHYVDTLKLINIFSVRRYLRDNPELELLSMGEEVFADRLNNIDLNEWSGMQSLSRIVQTIRKLGIAKLLTKIALMFKMQTPIILTAQKKS